MENSQPVILETPMADSIMQDPLNSLEGVTSPPSYVDILKKKLVESSGSSGENEESSREKRLHIYSWEVYHIFDLELSAQHSRWRKRGHEKMCDRLIVVGTGKGQSTLSVWGYFSKTC